MRTRSIGIFAALCACVTAPTVVGGQLTGSARPLTGSWVGVYQSYPGLTRMTLEIPATGPGRVEADLRMEPLVQTRTVGRSPMGIARVTIDYDAVGRTLSITPVAGTTRTTVSAPALAGVLDDATQTIAGVLVRAASDASPYFVMARSDAANDAFLETLADTLESRGTTNRRPSGLRLPGVGTLRLGGGKSPGQAKLVQWASRLSAEYPEIEPYRTEMGRLFGMARLLFRDDHFRPVFGKPYDELTRSDREAIVEDIRKVAPPRANFPEERANGAVRALESAFRVTGTGTYAAPDITLSVIALRTIDAWRARAMTWLPTLPSTADALNALALLQTAEARVLATFWPSERRAFGAALVASRLRVAGPLLAQRVDELLRRATTFASVPELAEMARFSSALPPARPRQVTPSRETPESTAKPVAGQVRARPPRRDVPPPAAVASRSAPAAAPEPDSIPALMALLPDDARRPQVARVEARINELVTSETRRDAEGLTRFGSGLEGLRTSGRFEQDIAAKYRVVSDHAAVQGLFRAVAERRAPLLESAEPTLTARIQAARTTADLGEIRTTYLSAASDFASPAGSRLYQLALRQHAQLRTAEETRAAEEAEARRAAASPCASAVNERSLDEDGDEPTERDMCLAYERLALGVQESYTAMRDECKGVNGSSNSMVALACLMGMAGSIGGGPQISLEAFEKVGCYKEGSGPGFTCKFVAKLNSRNTVAGPWMNRLSGGAIFGTFLRRGGTWTFVRN